MRVTHREDLPPAMEDPHARLEMTYIAEFLRGKGYQIQLLVNLPEDAAKQLMEEACRYASLKLTELEMGAEFVDALHADDAAVLTRLLERQRENS